MNKRISKKLKAMATHKHTERIIVRDFNVQEAFDKVIEHLIRTAPNEYCYFIDRESDGTYQVHAAAAKPMIYSTNSDKDIKHYVKMEPEEVTFYCQSCTGEITAQQDVDNDGECDPCFQGKNEMWAKEAAHEAYEYRNMKL